MSAQVLRWSQPRFHPAPCGICGETTRREFCATLQHEPHAETRWHPRCSQHEGDVIPGDNGVELRIGSRRIMDGFEVRDE